jgi:AcrR family transcriptional regulator
MPYTPGHKARTRSRILASARRLFNRCGFADVSIDAIMAAAGLTRGGFYAHFPTKSALYAEAIGHLLEERREADADPPDCCRDSRELARTIIASYLGDGHLNDIERGCPLIALPSDVARADARVKRAYGDLFVKMVTLFQSHIDDSGGDARERALAIGALCVGGMVLARAVDDRELGDAVRETCRTVALETGGWDRQSAASAAA